MARPFQPVDDSRQGLYAAQQALWRKLAGAARLKKLPDDGTETVRRINDLIGFLQAITQEGEWR